MSRRSLGNRRRSSLWQSVSSEVPKLDQGRVPWLLNACLARASTASLARTVQLDLGDRGIALELWYLGLHQPMGRGARATAEGTTSGPAVAKSCSLAVLQRWSAGQCSHAPLVPEPELDPWPLLPAEWGSCSFVPWDAGPCFLSAGRFCAAIGPEACRLRRRLVCMPVPLEPIRSKNGPKLLARPTPALHRPACGMHLPQLVTSSRPILLHLAPSPMQPSTPATPPARHQVQPHCAPSSPWPVQPPFQIQHAPCAQLHCAWKLTTRLDPSPSPTSTNRQLLTGVCCMPALTSCNTVLRSTSSPCLWPAI